MNLLNFLNKQTQFTDLGYFLISRSKLDNVDGLIPDAIKFIKHIKSDPTLWDDPMNPEELNDQEEMHRIITEYQILYEQYSKMIGEESFTWDDIQEMADEIQDLYDDFIRPLLEAISPSVCWFGTNPHQLNEIGYWQYEPVIASSDIPDENPIEDQIGDKESDVDLSISPFNSDNPPDCKCENVPDDHVLITDSQDVKAIFESIGQPDLYEYFHGLFVKMAEESSLAVYASIYGFVGIVPNGWKPCWRIL
jgi:hypothetical protein